jgi:16S rRNA G966 N2-methylase RsmD
MSLGAVKKPYPIPKRPTAIKTKEKVFNLLENVYISITIS